MQKHTKNRKLALRTTTVRSLSNESLTSANGGAIVTTNQSVNRGDCTNNCPTSGICD
jgi:hypothetical protein